MSEIPRISGDSSVGSLEPAHTPVVSTILDRRSVRYGFTDVEIPQSIIDEIIDCGLSAPSSKNAKPWSLHVVRSRETLDDIADAMTATEEKQTFIPHDPITGQPRERFVSTVDESADVLREVSLAIFLENRGEFSVNRAAVAAAAAAAAMDDRTQQEVLIGMGLEYVGLGACIENIWLAAESNGVRGAFIGDLLICEDYIKQRLSMIGDVVGAVALGYSDVEVQGKPLNRENVIWHS